MAGDISGCCLSNWSALVATVSAVYTAVVHYCLRDSQDQLACRLTLAMENPSRLAELADNVAMLQRLTFRKSIQIHCCLTVT